MVLPVLYAIADASGPTPIVEQVKAFVAGGARLIQVRDKHASGRDLYECVLAALLETRPAGAKLVVNDRADIAVIAGADGVHVGQEDLPAGKVREIVGPNLIVGVSTHDVEQFRAALSEPVDYMTTSQSARSSRPARRRIPIPWWASIWSARPGP
jgi:thiamine-phosphate pyrophosphorylase